MMYAYIYYKGIIPCINVQRNVSHSDFTFVCTREYTQDLCVNFNIFSY